MGEGREMEGEWRGGGEGGVVGRRGGVDGMMVEAFYYGGCS